VQRTLLILLVAASYLLLAGGRTWTLGPLLALAALAVLAAPARTLRLRPSWRPLDAALIGIVLAMAVQLIPLPAAVVNLVSPAAARVRAALQFTPLTPAPADLMTISVDPASTAAALGVVVLGIVSFWIARALFSMGGHTRAFCRSLAVIGAVAALLALVQKATTPKLLLFTVEPIARSTNPFGAFTNRNHMAAWLLLIAAPLVGYLVARMRIHDEDFRGHWQPWLKHFLVSGMALTAVAIVIVLGVLLATLSRSAVIGLGAAAVTGWWLGKPRMSVERTNLPARLGTIGVALLAAMVFIDLDGWATRLQESIDVPDGSFSRTTIWLETLPVIRDFWLTGTGAGTYSDAMTQYQQSRVWVGSMQRWAHFNNAHSHYLQLLSEGGVLLTIPVVAALAAFAKLARASVLADKGEMFWVRIGAAAGLAGLAVQSLFEVALTMPANTVLAGVLAGLVLYQREAPYQATQC
jgi:O-antigen ligase